jgi:lipopolysaccharide/colanic/teichoic acid biosynthesis glycosyltransferase
VSVGSPIFYQQERIGLADKAFFMLKFRTMGVDAEAESGPMLSDREDPRVLPSGKWLRATRLDELPQLINIFRGEMSIVGPRPERPEMTEGFVQTVAGYQHRHRIRPGLTGLAQIHGRYHTSAQHKLGYDLHYATNWSPILDLQILLQTIWVVLARRV